jgi:hypothetical protein
MAGVPQLISPWYVETYMGARRIEASGLGVAFTPIPGHETFVETIERVAGDLQINDRVDAFSNAHGGTDVENSITSVVNTTLSDSGVALPTKRNLRAEAGLRDARPTTVLASSNSKDAVNATFANTAAL